MAKRRRKSRRTYRRKGAKSWKALVKRYGVKKAAKLYRKSKGKRRPFRGRRRNKRKSRRYRRSRR
jgi:hypothetical protein